jgi:hypothetical protein
MCNRLEGQAAMTEYEGMHIQDNLRNGGGDLIICDWQKWSVFFLDFGNCHEHGTLHDLIYYVPYAIGKNQELHEYYGL